jgi:hypothetical protein
MVSTYSLVGIIVSTAGTDILAAVAVGPKQLGTEDKLVYVIGQKLNNVYILNSSTLKLDGSGSRTTH